MLGAAFLLGSLAIYGQWVLAGVVEEKSNRVVELILSTVRPRHLLVGKVVGIGLLGLTQLALVAGLAAVLLAAGVYDAPASLGRSVALVVPWFALGFALYAVAYATAGALAAQQQDANSAGQPVTYTLLAAFFVGYAALSADAESAIANLLTVFPSPHRSFYQREARSWACRYGSTCSRSYLCSPRSTRSSGLPVASTPKAYCTRARACACVRPGGSPTSVTERRLSVLKTMLTIPDSADRRTDSPLLGRCEIVTLSFPRRA